MAGEVSKGEVSRSKKFEGIKELLSLLDKSDKEIVGLQHLLLQLRVTHEWLCMAGEDTEDELADLEEKFHVLSSLEEWFERAFAHVRLEGYDGAYLPGWRLLALLKSSLQTFGSINQPCSWAFGAVQGSGSGPLWSSSPGISQFPGRGPGWR